MIPGVVLAGGRASRMGGQDKAGVTVAGRSLLDWACLRLGPQVGALAVNLRAGSEAPGRTVLRDPVPGQPGPLAGVLAAMDWAASRGAARVATLPVDVPCPPPDMVARLAAVGPLAHAATLGGGAHPACAVWPVALAPALRAALAAGQRRVRDFAVAQGSVEVPFTDTFFNVNTPADLALAEALLSAPGPRLYGVTGWKNAGKTTLVEGLLRVLTTRGLRVASVKHAHHAAEIDHPGRDSHRHRMAGAAQVILSTPARWALLTEREGEVPLATLLARLDPCDLVLVEGWKAEGHRKIEVHRPATGHRLMAPGNPTIRAVATDAPLPGLAVPVLDLNDPAAVADFVLSDL